MTFKAGTDVAARVLVADDDPATCRQIKALLEGAGHVVEIARDGSGAVDCVAAFQPDVVLLDVVMPTLGGLEACRIIKARFANKLLPVLLLVPKTDAASRARGLTAGADDWLQKPVDGPSLLGRVAALVRMKRVHDEMRAARQLLERMSAKDELTGMMSYRNLSLILRDHLERAARDKEPLTAALFDVDGLDALNARIDRSAGDTVLRQLAGAVASRTRPNDVVFRYGPDEALILLPRLSLLDGLGFAQAVVRDFAERTRSAEGGALSSSASAGVASFPGRDVRDAESLLRTVDRALSLAKGAGGGRCCAFRQQGMVLFGREPPQDPRAD